MTLAVRNYDTLEHGRPWADRAKITVADSGSVDFFVVRHGELRARVSVHQRRAS